MTLALTDTAPRQAASQPAGWVGHLDLHYTRDGERTLSMDRHSGPLRVLKRLLPEGPGICHHVLVHPPGGIVGGDRLEIDARLDAGAHALLTTPGATRFYRSAGRPAVQQTRLRVAAGARLEWLPLETIAYRGCLAENRLRLELEPGAEAMGWDLLALGLPAAGQAWDHGRYLQQVELPGVWLERQPDPGQLDLLDGPLGLAGRRVLGTCWFAAGTALPAPRREALLEAVRAVLDDGVTAAVSSVTGGVIDRETAGVTAGVTAVQPSVLVLRVLAGRVEPAMALLAKVRAAWRLAAWQLQANPPRVWRC
jgi:urease accessory protein